MHLSSFLEPLLLLFLFLFIIIPFQDSFLLVKFDTHLDAVVGDINNNHVGINLRSVSWIVTVEAGTKGFKVDLSNLKHMMVWIEYIDESDLIKVLINYFLAVRLWSLAFILKIDLSDHLKEFVYEGLLTSNGARASPFHVVDRGKYKSFGLLDLVKEMKIVDNGSDEDGYCFICSDEEIKVNRYPMHMSFTYLALILGGVPIAVARVNTIVFNINFFLKRREGGDAGGRVGDYLLNKSHASWCLSEVNIMTGGSNKNRIVREGASDVVYLGCLSDGKQVADKRVSTVRGVEGCVILFSSEFATKARELSPALGLVL
ncbi:hypothetical protein Drorol1_Dr00025846 [Drosera rotundifolia]